VRAYTVATVAVALRVSPKWVDNVLSHHTVRGVSQSRQGIARSLTEEAVSVLETALRLSKAFGIPVAQGLEIAQSLIASGTTNPQCAGDHCTLTVDAAAVRRHVAARLTDAVEYAPVPRRGRPRTRRQ
jgi:hypothetical protein